MFFNRGILALRKGLPTHNTPLTMVAVRPGQSVAVFGGIDLALVADIARITGLNGRTVVVNADGTARQQIEAAAAEAGTLVEVVDRLPDIAAAGPGFDLAVIQAALATLTVDARTALVTAAAASVRPSQRVVVIEGTRRAGWLGSLAKASPALSQDEAVQLLTNAGLVAVRPIGAADGQQFFEGRTAR